MIEFECDPFDQSEIRLRTLHSGEYASTILQNDFKNAHADGENLLQTFFKDRIFSRNTPFDKTIHRNNRKNFHNPPHNTTYNTTYNTTTQHNIQHNIKVQHTTPHTTAMENEAMCTGNITLL